MNVMESIYLESDPNTPVEVDTDGFGYLTVTVPYKGAKLDTSMYTPGEGRPRTIGAVWRLVVRNMVQASTEAIYYYLEHTEPTHWALTPEYRRVFDAELPSL